MLLVSFNIVLTFIVCFLSNNNIKLTMITPDNEKKNKNSIPVKSINQPIRLSYIFTLLTTRGLRFFGIYFLQSIVDSLWSMAISTPNLCNILY